MKAVLTRVECASVKTGGKTIAEIGPGFLVLLGIHVSDTESDAVRIADKICNLRVFSDENGKMNVSPKDAGAEILIISQFTLYGNCKSRRPGFTEAARPETAIPLYELCVSKCREYGFHVTTGGIRRRYESGFGKRRPCNHHSGYK